MKTLDGTSRAGGAVAVVVLSAILSGCYSYVPYGYVSYDELPATQPYLFTVPDAAASGAAASDATALTGTSAGAVTPVFVAPAYYSVPYPYYGWPAWRGPSVSLGFGYWGGCCYGWHGHILPIAQHLTCAGPATRWAS